MSSKPNYASLLGKKCCCEKRYRKTRSNEKYGGGFRTTWVIEDCQFFAGIFIGVRYKINGKTGFDPEYGSEFFEEDRVLVALIIKDHLTEPVTVPFESIAFL